MRQAAAERAAIAHLWIADLCRRVRDDRATPVEQGGRRHVVVHGAGADLELPIVLLDAGEPRDARDVDERLRLTQAQLHQGDLAVPAGKKLRAALASRQLRYRSIQRSGTVVLECGRDHAWPPCPEPCRGALMMRHSFSGRSIMSMCFTPNSESASTAADTMLGV